MEPGEIPSPSPVYTRPPPPNYSTARKRLASEHVSGDSTTPVAKKARAVQHSESDDIQ